MTETEALHTAARRYCQERAWMWRERYGEWDRANVTTARPAAEEIRRRQQEAESLYPRYQVLDAILAEVEGFVPYDLGDFEEARSLLCLAGQTAHDVDTEAHKEENARQVIAEERELFCQYLRGLSLEALMSVEPLPSRRTLAERESRHLWDALRDRWKVEDPSRHSVILVDLPANVLAFQAEWFHYAVPTEALHRILVERGIHRVYELREYGPEYELDLCLLEPYYTGAEGYWTSAGFDWLIYASHESSITLAGEWLINAIKAVWPEWHLRVYSSWEYEPPPRDE